MRFRRMDLNLLVALDALLTEQSVTRAGERVYLSQPAMSAALARLRLHFKDELITPVGRKMVLTPLAESLRQPVREVLNLSGAILDSTLGFDAKSSDRRFSVVASDVVMTVVIPDVIKKLRVEAPSVSLELFEPDARRLVEDLEHGDVDLLIIPLEYASGNCPREELYEDSYSCVVWSENPCVGDQLSLDQFAELEHVSMNFGRARTADLPTSYVAKIGLRQKVGIWAPVFSLLPDLVVGTHRIATIPTRLAQIKSAYLPIRILRPPVDFPKIVEVMQWHSVQNQDPGIAWFRNLLKSSIQSAGCLQQH